MTWFTIDSHMCGDILGLSGLFAILAFTLPSGLSWLAIEELNQVLL